MNRTRFIRPVKRWSLCCERARERNLYKHQKLEHFVCVYIFRTCECVLFLLFSLCSKTRSAEDVEPYPNEWRQWNCVYGKSFTGFLTHLLVILFGLSLYASTIVDAHLWNTHTLCVAGKTVNNSNSNTTHKHNSIYTESSIVIWIINAKRTTE